MRTTIRLDDDVVAEVERLRKDQGVGLSEAVNRLIRAAMVPGTNRPVYRHRTSNMGIKVDVSDIGAVLELLDES